MRREASPSRERFTGEARLLLECVRFSLGLCDSEKLTEAVKNPVDWPRFLELTLEQGLAGPVLEALCAMEIPILAKLKAARAAGAMRSLFLVQQLGEILQLLQSEGIGTIAFKGPVLSMDAWGDPAMRAAGDLDLLVRPAEMAKARMLLISRGFEPIFPTSTVAEAKYLSNLTGPRLEKYVRSHSEHHLMRPGDRLNIDLHSNLALKQFALRVDCESLWSGTREIMLAGKGIRTFSEEDTLLMLAVNAAKDCWRRFDRICDVAAMVVRHPKIDFQSVLTRARRTGAGRMMLITVQMANELLGLPLSDPVKLAIGKDKGVMNFSRRLSIDLSDQRGDIHQRELALQLRAREQAGGKLRYLLCQCYPTVGDWAALPLPAGLGFVHVALRPWRIMIQRRSRTRSATRLSSSKSSGAAKR